MAKSHRRRRSHKKSRRQSQNNQNQNQLNSLFGGEGAAPYVAAVAGAPSEQHAAGGSNAIALTPMKGGSGLSILAPSSIGSGGNLIAGGSSLPHMGGKRHRKPSKKGGNLLQQLAVPAVLLYANNTFGRRGKSYARKTRRFRGSRKFRK